LDISYHSIEDVSSDTWYITARDVIIFQGKELKGGVVVHSLGFSVEGSGFESRPRPSESMKLFSTYNLIP
jgi:hypothetical protein